MSSSKIMILFIIGITFIIIGSLSLSSVKNYRQKSVKKIQIIATIYPPYEFARIIGGEKTEVRLLLPLGAESHSFEPRPQDIVKLQQADIFIFVNQFMEPWADDILRSVKKPDLLVIEAGEDTRYQKGENSDRDDINKGVDSHIWLDLANTQKMVANISRGLEKKDPANALYYQKNTKEYIAKLQELDSQYRQVLSNCRKKTIIFVGHYAFGYLAKRYNLSYLSLQGFSPDSEPSPLAIIQLVEQIKKEKINHIFYEELESPKLAETIKQETGATLLRLNSAHTVSPQQFAEKISFISLMQKNLKQLAIGLECQINE